MKLRIYQVDAFTDKVFGGNPAAIVPLDHWPPDSLLQKIAFENNLAETGYFIRKGTEYEIRWFTPTVEVDLCGHATLAAAHVLFNYEGHVLDEIIFNSERSGRLVVRKEESGLTLDFPTDIISKVELTTDLLRSFHIKAKEAYKGKSDYMFVFNSEKEISELLPNLDVITKLDARGLIATAKGDDVDFVSRFFAPQSGINEDPVTGSAHTTLTPYWAKVLGKEELTAIQLSERKGHLKCKLLGDRVEISGHAVTYMFGEIEV